MAKRIPPFNLAEVAGYALRFPDAVQREAVHR